MSYSKAPWTIEYRDNDRYLRDADDKALMCDTEYYPWTPSSEEDWNLISSSPELLSSLKELVEITANLRRNPNRTYGVVDAIVKAEKCIAKAEGRKV